MPKDRRPDPDLPRLSEGGDDEPTVVMGRQVMPPMAIRPRNVKRPVRVDSPPPSSSKTVVMRGAPGRVPARVPARHPSMPPGGSLPPIGSYYPPPPPDASFPPGAVGSFPPPPVGSFPPPHAGSYTPPPVAAYQPPPVASYHPPQAGSFGPPPVGSFPPPPLGSFPPPAVGSLQPPRMSAPPPAANLPANVRVATVPPPTRTDVTGVSPTAGAPMFLGAVLLTVPLLLATVAIAVLALR